MTLVDYTAHFWGEKHIGYNVLYENMKKGEEAVQDLVNFLKERINMEDDILKCIGKNLNRTNSYISSKGTFIDMWQLTKGTLELWTEIQTSMLANLNELSKDVTRYQDELIKMRKKTKDVETLEAINLMQTTTTCLQKAKETYNQRCAEVLLLKSNNKEWNSTNTKEYLRVRNKLNKAHEEYRHYMERYTEIRDIFEQKILLAAKFFQEHDKAHLFQMKKFFVRLAKHLEDSYNAYAQVCMDFRKNIEHVDVEDIMLRFVEEKGTGMEIPQKLNWTEADELPAELDIISGIHSQSSSNSSAIMGPISGSQPTVNDLLCLDDTWISSSTTLNNSNLITSSKSSQQSTATVNAYSNTKASINLLDANEKLSDNDIENLSEAGQTSINQNQTSNNGTSISNVQQQISLWLTRQKLGNWRLKKHSASQSSLPTTAPCDVSELLINISETDFSKSCGDKGNSFLKHCQKKNTKNSIGELTRINMQSKQKTEIQPVTYNETLIRTTKVSDPLLEFGPPPPLPLTDPPLLTDNVNFIEDAILKQPVEDNNKPVEIKTEVLNIKPRWSTDSSASDDEDTAAEFQTSKIRQLKIHPLNESQKSNLKVSLDELRTAVGQITLQKSSTFENDPWKVGTEVCSTSSFSQSYGPIRPDLTGDAQFRRFDRNSTADYDFSQSTSIFSNANSIARARPRSHTPLSFGMKQNLTSTSIPLNAHQQHNIVTTSTSNIMVQSNLGQYSSSNSIAATAAVSTSNASSVTSPHTSLYGTPASVIFES